MPAPGPPARPTGDDLAQAAIRLRVYTLRHLWGLPVENKHKVAYWKFINNGLPTAARLHKDSPCACGTGGARPARAHVFWECPVARAIWEPLQELLSARAPMALTPWHLWLCRPPPGMDGRVWGAVCLAAVTAMDSGRAYLVRLSLPPPAPPQPARDRGQRTLLELWHAGGDDAAAAEEDARQRAVRGMGREELWADAVPGEDPDAFEEQHVAAADDRVRRAAAHARTLFEARLRAMAVVLSADPWAAALPPGHQVMSWDAAARRLRVQGLPGPAV